MQSKEFYLVEQGFYKLKANKQKKSNIVEAEFLTILVAY
jgi:hypothetical protein